MPKRKPLCQRTNRVQPLERNRFYLLSPEGQELIREWARRGSELPELPEAEHYFEGFIYLWFAANGWAACVANTDSDRKWVDGVAADSTLGRGFSKLLAECEGFVKATAEFSELWPIFKSSRIRHRMLVLPTDCSRQTRIKTYLDAEIEHEPTCWLLHDETPPVDMLHTFETLYRVRCNLFHGEKNMDLDNDRLIVQAAYGVLRFIVNELLLTV